MWTKAVRTETTAGIRAGRAACQGPNSRNSYYDPAPQGSGAAGRTALGPSLGCPAGCCGSSRFGPDMPGMGQRFNLPKQDCEWVAESASVVLVIRDPARPPAEGGADSDIGVTDWTTVAIGSERMVLWAGPGARVPGIRLG